MITSDARHPSRRLLAPLVGATALAGVLLSGAALPAVADPTTTPAPYCAGEDPGDLLNGVTCDQDLAESTPETPDPRPSEPPDDDGPGGGGNGPGGGGNGPR